METKTGEQKEFKILDTAGEEEYQNMLDVWIGQANGFILVFALNDQKSFDDIDNKIKRIEKNEVGHLPIILVGNKCDLKEERKITTQQATEYAKSMGAKYFETSAFTDSNGNIKNAFQKCGNLILSKSQRKKHGTKKKGCFLCNIF